MVAEMDSPTSRTCQMGFRILAFWGSVACPLEHGQQHGQRRRWPRPPCSASSAAQASPSLARCHPVPPSPRAGVARDVTLGCRAQLCPVECPHACAPPRGPAPLPPFLCRGRTLVTRHPRRSSARRVASAGAGRRRRPRRSGGAATDPRPQGRQVARHQTRVRLGYTRVQIGTPFQLCPNSPAPNRDALTAIWGTLDGTGT